AADVWPPPGFGPIPFGTEAGSCLVLVLLALPAAFASYAGARRGGGFLATAGLLLSAGLAALLLYAEYLLFQSLPFTVRSDAYGAVVAALGTWHAFHVAMGLVAALFALLRMVRRGMSAERALALRVSALMNAYIAVQGLLVFGVIYLSTA
ncbi:MAG: cytochrome c oxidase subunit 3, partial [Woeseia sp.]